LIYGLASHPRPLSSRSSELMLIPPRTCVTNVISPILHDFALAAASK
jgi:hypothetical protein